jgi:uncharacterized cupredoxin-like copper-binding protein
MSRAARLAAAAIAAATLTGTGWGIVAASASQRGPALLGPEDVTVRLGIEHSQFETSQLRVVERTHVRFVVDNGDPIGHELIVGPPDVHARHASGTHARHPTVPGEVSIQPNQRASTSYRFDEPGTVEFACHLPGHYDYGMHGTIEVVPGPDHRL